MCTKLGLAADTLAATPHPGPFPYLRVFLRLCLRVYVCARACTVGSMCVWVCV